MALLVWGTFVDIQERARCYDGGICSYQVAVMLPCVSLFWHKQIHTGIPKRALCGSDETRDEVGRLAKVRLPA